MAKPYYLFKYNYKQDDDFTVIAHRGASAYYPENTLAAFGGAIDMGADMVELDVQLTADGEVIVFHDEKANRCTNGRGLIADYTLAELKKLDAGSWFDKKFQRTRIPTLDEALGFCKNKIAVNIEIKTEAVRDKISGGIEEKCLKIVRRAGMSPHTVFSSFDPRALKHLKEINSSVHAAVLFEKKHYGSRLPSDIITSLGVDAFNCSSRELNRKWLADLKMNGIPVNIYTVNDDKNMKRLLTMGIGGIFTNCPDVLKKVWADFRCTQKSENIEG